uniref:Uncharacterized protein n=1 Tax=Molossus molossus TaxID=27622 RepID=A0A7J8EC73_MOLMO|nr:hypothetical protein HJG59_001961 [Molossus molossus]
MELELQSYFVRKLIQNFMMEYVSAVKKFLSGV